MSNNKQLQYIRLFLGKPADKERLPGNKAALRLTGVGGI
jgi:hypothetical protein